MFKQRSQPCYLAYCALPFMVVGAMAWATPWLLFTTNVETQIFDAVVGLVTIHMVYAFIRSERTTQVLRHHEPVFHYGLTFALHRAIHWKKCIRNVRWEHRHVAVSSNPRRDVVFALEIPMGAFSNRLDGTRTTQPSEIRSLNLVSDFHCCDYAHLTASRALDIDDNTRSSLMPSKAQLGHYARMGRQWSEIRRSPSAFLSNDLSNANGTVAGESPSRDLPSDVCSTHMSKASAIETSEINQHTAFASVRGGRNTRMLGKFFEISSHERSFDVSILNVITHRSSYVTT